MTESIFKWLTKPAKWYEFWLPQSGVAGGLIVGGMFAVLPTVLFIALS
jgi:hypothetical protein